MRPGTVSLLVLMTVFLNNLSAGICCILQQMIKFSSESDCFFGVLRGAPYR